MKTSDLLLTLSAAAAAALAPIPTTARPGAPAPLPSGGVLLADGRIESSGLQGSWRSVSELASGRFAVHSDLGVFHTADIFDGRTRWKVEPSGGSHPLDSAFARRASTTESWLARFAWTRADFGGAARSRAEMVSEGGRRFRLLTATPVGGVPVRLWFDAQDGRLARAERPAWFFTLTTTYADYRDVDGRSLPFEVTESGAETVLKINVDHYRFSAAAPPRAFARPQLPADATVPATGTSVPVVIFPQLTLQAVVNGRPMDFLFDTGGHSILTPDAAKALGLKAVGSAQTGGSGAGTLLQQDTRVNELRIGGAVLRDQHFYVLSFPYSNVEQGSKPPLAGLLGLEVAERFIVRLDYRAGRITLLPRSANPACGSGWRAIRFTDDMPTIEAVLDGAPAAFTVDTGNNGGLMLYRHWMKSHGLQPRYDRGVEALSYGAGGASRNWVSYARSFAIGKPTIARPMVRTTDDKGGVALSISEAGNLGTSLLANYSITFDYSRSRACFDYVPGYQPVPFNRAGLRAIKDNPQSFLITLVNEGGPAWNAGLRKDDRLVTVNGKPARELGSGELTLAFTQAPGSRVTLRYERAGVVHHALLITREMLK